MSEEEKKTYPEGTVRISAWEYRDIIEDISRLRRELEISSNECHKEWSRGYDLSNKNKELESKLKETTDKLNYATEFINLSDDRKAAYKSFLFDKQQEQEADNE